MINENIKPSIDFAVPYYAYVGTSALSVPANSYINKTLTFSPACDWARMVITAEFQQAGAMVNISPVSGSKAWVTVVNHTSSAISGFLRVRALLSGELTMTIS